MKPLPFAFVAVIGLAVSVHSQDSNSQESAPVEETPARILGTIPDGTPPPPEAPKPEFIVRAKDILETTVVEQDGRTITLQEIKPIDLPAPPQEVAPVAHESDPTFQARLADYQATHPRPDQIRISSVIYHPKDSAPRSLVRWWPPASKEPISFWTSANLNLIIGGFRSFIDSSGKAHSLSFGWENFDAQRLAQLNASKKNLAAIPVIPDFPDGAATCAFIGQAPADADLLVIQSLHDLYNKNHEQLLTAYQGRTQARLAAEAELKAHPPQPKDITLNYWRIGSGTNDLTNGGAR